MLDNKLIENALASTWKSEWDICELTMVDKDWDKITTKWKFSIEKFYAFLLSPEFIEKYQNLQIVKWSMHYYVGEFWKAIHDYQSGNEQPLIDLLSKIWAK